LAALMRFLQSATQIGTRFLVDATLEEEQCMGVRVIVGISPKGIH
jgi:exosome complex RNA-binding protein Rrp42 (RNase PH superfamily)